MQEKLAICLLASEVEPLSKTGGLADVSGALTRYLYGAGHDVRLFTPCYASIERAAHAAQPVAALQQVPLAVGPNNYRFSVLRAQLPGGSPPGGSTPCATASCMPTPSPRSARRMRARSARMSTAWGCRTACASAAAP